MWQTQTETESDGQIIKLQFHSPGGPLRFSEVLQLWRDNVDFCRYFNVQLSAIPFEAFRWETPAITTTTLEYPFECVVLNSPDLARVSDATAFRDAFPSHAENGIAVFPNLGNDAILVVPCPVGPHSAYGHLAAFVRNAPEEQQ